MIITDPKFLSQKSTEMHTTTDGVNTIVSKIKRALPTAWVKGYGLAAIQIGIPKRVCWYVYEGIETILVNPRIIYQNNLAIKSKEGCLSIPDKWFVTERYTYVNLVATNIEGSIKRFNEEAAIIQHEIDHMDGILCTERLYIPKPKIGRNDPCICGSGEKYKRCCLK